MKKKFLAVLLSASMAATVLAGCGGSDSGTTSDQGAADAAAGSEAENADAQSGDEAGADDSAQADQAADAQTDAGEETKGAGDAIVTEPTELTYIFADGDEGAKASMNEIVEKFNETYPDITVTVEPGNGGAYSEFIKTKDSVGEFPDVMEMRDTAMYVRAH